ncbi:hypothetical protein WEN_01930 [Mycoplasma wenyonii str. Massachusetts]|uniref:Uncharacterized protein n=1 Tax=Mycoplasma wenyonii (strain Massachusetts) TaxID=1197325 RepID=I6YLK0_MYCWM|nr:hypothetical protein [Mycoplasma wenyonii]AFN65179.1 hypothetical protein WEN_01930 [Mycoplasma wenyonii str. Massachusetts]
MTATLIAKIAIGGVAGATAITPAVFYIAPPWSIELTKEKFEEFKKSYGFDSCQTFLSNDDKKHLLFLCLKKEGEQQTNNKIHYYFYNGGSWEKALSLEKDPNNRSVGFFLVKTETWWGYGRRKINNVGDVQPNKLTEHDKRGMICNFGSSIETKGNNRENKKFVCLKNTGHELTWKLQNTQESKLFEE